MQLLLSYCFSLRNAPPSCRILSKVLRPWKPRQFALTAFGSHGIIFVFGALMKLYSFFLSLVLASTFALTAHAQSQTPAKPADDTPSSQELASTQAPTGPSSRADAYFDFTMGHIYEQQYENTSKAEFASQAIDFYKKAYALDPKSPVIGERLAEMYWKAQRTRDAVTEAQEILKRHPDDAPTRRLLARIYLRSLGDLSAGVGQSEVAGKAIEQYKEIYRLDPSDTESALWLTRLYRLRNEHDKAEAVLRGILKDDPENEPAVEQLTQLLLDQGKSADAVALLEGMTNRAPPRRFWTCSATPTRKPKICPRQSRPIARLSTSIPPN